MKLPRAGWVRSTIWWKLANPDSSKWFRPWLNEPLTVQVGVSVPLYRTAMLRVPKSSWLLAVRLSIFKVRIGAGVSSFARFVRFVVVGSPNIEKLT